VAAGIHIIVVPTIGSRAKKRSYNSPEKCRWYSKHPKSNTE